jgi:hypothetical protein
VTTVVAMVDISFRLSLWEAGTPVSVKLSRAPGYVASHAG